MNSTSWKMICNLNPIAQAINKDQRQLRPESHFPKFFKSWALSPRLKRFSSGCNSLNPALRPNLRPNSDDSLCHPIDVNSPKIKIWVICHFFRASVRFPKLNKTSSISVTSFIFVKKFYFNSKISFYLAKTCVLAPRKNAWKWHLKKNSIMCVISLRLCVSSHIFQLC